MADCAVVTLGQRFEMSQDATLFELVKNPEMVGHLVVTLVGDCLAFTGSKLLKSVDGLEMAIINW